MNDILSFRFFLRLRLCLCLLLCLSLSLSSCQAQNHKVTFEVISHSKLDNDEKVFVTGNQPSLGNWNAASVSLEKKHEVWINEFQFPAGTHLEYKFTKGSWDTEALTSDYRVPPNHQFVVTQDTTLRYHISAWRDSLLNTAPKITGHYEIHEGVVPIGLPSRRVVVWLPPSYDSSAGRRYPVLYLHDGQNVFDPHTSSLGYDWRIDEIADSLIRRNEIAEFIAVAVYSNADVRSKEYSDDADLGEKYQDFMCCQLKPWIDKTYRTLPDAENTAVMGASMGGLISFILAWEYPDVFSKAACMSPAFKVEVGAIDVNYIEDVAKDQSTKDIELYIDNGTLDLEAILQPGIDEMTQLLDAKEYEYTWFLDQGAPHNERAWSARAWRPIIQFFGK